MVKECRSRNGKFPGAKAGKLAVHITSNETGFFEMRMDVKRGLFIAVDGEQYFEAENKDELHTFMQERARATRQITWHRYICIVYEPEGPGEFAHRRNIRRDRPLEPNDEGLFDDVGGIRLDWEIIDISDPITVPGHRTARRKTRDVYDDGSPGNESWQHDGNLPELAIPYSDEALATLKHLRHGLGVIHTAIAKLLIGTPEAIAARLADPNARLLVPGQED